MISPQGQKNLYCITVCKAWCCRYLVFEKERIDKDDIQFFTSRNIKIEGNKLIVPCRCNWLSNQNKCKFYSRRPLSCMAYECDVLKRYISDIVTNEAKATSAYSTP